MSELRVEPLTGRQVLLATDRAGRPYDFARPAAINVDVSYRSDCPFCLGNEHTTSATRWQWPAGAREWTTRVVANKYPAICAMPNDAGDPYGIHEVFVESPRHCAWMRQLVVDEWTGLVLAWQARLADYVAHDEFNYHSLFKNVGEAGGASLTHIHSQAIAMPMVPPYMQRERERLRHQFSASGRCATCDLIERERTSDRVVFVDDDWIVFCPAASRQAYETWLVPREHAGCFATYLVNESARQRFTEKLRSLLTTIEYLLPGEGYNVLLVTQPNERALHWRLEIVPRTATFAGFELASGMYLCTVDPVAAAQRIRLAIESDEATNSDV